MQARLQVLHDKANVKQVRLLPVTLIGRSTDCNLKIASSQVSRNHCRITLGDNAVFVEDLGSANGTLIDGQALPAHQPTSILPGSHLVVGPAEFLIDFVGLASPTIILPGTQSGLPPDLPSTEVIAPPAVLADQLPFVAAAVIEEPQPNIHSDVPVAADTPVAADAPFAADTPVAADTVVPQPAFDATLADTDPSTIVDQFVPAALGFDDSANPAETGEYEETVQFNFQETQPETAAFTANAAEAEAAESKKPGLKSLFSLFGRKSKSHQDATPSVAVVAAAAPSVFLPTMDQQAAAVAIETPVDAATPAYEAQEIAPESQEGDTSVAEASTDEDDGFQQFLQQL